MKRIFACLAAASVALLAAEGARAQAMELKLSHFLPTVHGMHKDFLEPWSRELEACSGGKVKVSIFPAGTQLGNVAKQYDQVRAGVVDIAHGLTGIPRGRFPKTAIIDLPFLTESADAATRTLWALYPEWLKDEYADVKVLALHAHNAGLIHTRERQIKTMDDMKGLRIRTPSPAIGEMLKALGATPQGLPPGEVYEALQKGTIDGTVFPWDPVASFKLSEVLKYHLDARAYTTSFFFVMNQQKYQSLPDDVRQCIDKSSGDALIPKFGPWWDSWDAPGLKAAQERGNVITPMSDEERDRWRKALAPMIDAWLTRMEQEEGVKNARDLYAATQKHVAEFEKK